MTNEDDIVAVLVGFCKAAKEMQEERLAQGMKKVAIIEDEWARQHKIALAECERLGITFEQYCEAHDDMLRNIEPIKV